MAGEELRNKIARANDAYRSGNPVMDDAAYDELLEQYREIAGRDEYEAFARTLHEKAGKVRLPYVLGSLSKLKCQEPESIAKFAARHAPKALHVSAKVDGISACLVYEKGRLVKAATRGDGTFGESLDDKILSVKGVPARLPEPLDLAIRGELVILKSDFASMEGTSPRNVCAGIMNRKGPAGKDVENVTFVPYTVLGGEYGKEEQFRLLDRLGFSTAWRTILEGGEYAALFADENALASRMFEYATQNLPYEIDGVVVSSPDYRNEDAYYPEAQAAVKTNTLVAESKLVDVSWEGPSKDGVMSPVAILEPVEIGGAIVAKATLHNVNYISSLGLKYGCGVVVSKRGDIIPAVDSVTSTPEGAKDIATPTECPCCGSALVWDGADLRCPNRACRAQAVGRIEYFIKKAGVANASYKTLDALGLDSYEKLLLFAPRPSRLIEKKLAEELKTKIFSRSPVDLFCALNIKDVGEKLKRRIVDFYGWDRVRDPGFGFEGPLPKGIGDITLDKFRAALSENVKVVEMIEGDARYTWKPGADGKAPAAKKGMSICFTGALSIPRGDASRLAEAAGFEVKTSVSRGLTYLVTQDPNSGSSKNEKAKKYGVSVIDEKKFMELVKPDAGSIMDI